MPAFLAEFARANNNERSAAAWNYWNYFNGNDMSAWPKRYDPNGIELEQKFEQDLQQARATSWHDYVDPDIPDLVAASVFSSSNSVESDVGEDLFMFGSVEGATAVARAIEILGASLPVPMCKNWGSQRRSTSRPVTHHIHDPSTFQEMQLVSESTPGNEFAVDDQSLPTESQLDLATRHRLAAAYGGGYRDTVHLSAASPNSSSFASMYPMAANATLPARDDDDSGGGKATMDELADSAKQAVAISRAANVTSSDAPTESSRNPHGANYAVYVADSMFASLYLATAAPAPALAAALDNGGGKADRCYVDDVIAAPADIPRVETPEL
jgi:hypothetical protein